MVSMSSKEAKEPFDEEEYENYLRQIIEGELEHVYLHSVHADNITELPEGGICLADS